MASRASKSPLWILTVIGFVIGGLAGFLFRPSAFLIGQLPFDVVVTRGVFLQGIDRVMVGLAESSFNQMLVMACIGAAVGLALGYVIARK